MGQNYEVYKQSMSTGQIQAAVSQIATSVQKDAQGFLANSRLLAWANFEFRFLLFSPEIIRITAVTLANPLNL